MEVFLCHCIVRMLYAAAYVNGYADSILKSMKYNVKNYKNNTDIFGDVITFHQ